MSQVMAANWLADIDAFRSLPLEQMRRLSANAHSVALACGDALVRAGESADALYVVMSGRLVAQTGEGDDNGEEDAVSAQASARSDANAAQTHLPDAAFGPGDALDPLAFFARGTHPATITAARDSVVLRLAWEDLEQAADHAPGLWAGIAASLADRLAHVSPARQPRRARAKTLMICHGGRDYVPPVVLDRIGEALDSQAECQFLSAETLGQDLAGGIALEDPQVVHWLADQEQRAGLVVYLAEAERSAWTEHALNHADEVIIVGLTGGQGATASVPLNPVEQMVLERLGADACRLVLIEEGAKGVRAGEAARWLDQRPVRAHHHVRMEETRDYDRLARFILGRARGLMLCGAGLAGAAHLGALRALRAAGFIPDAIIGAGAGVVMGGLTALGWDPDTIDALTGDLFITRKALARRSRMEAALFDHRRLDRLTRRLLPAADIADLPLPFIAVSADLSTGAPYLHRLGSLQQPLRAGWLPLGVVAPFITEEGALIADGSAMAMAGWQASEVLGVGKGVAVRPALAPLGPAPVSYHELRGAPRRLSVALKQFFGLGGPAPKPGQSAQTLTPLTDITARAGAMQSRWLGGEGDRLAAAHPPLVMAPPVPASISLLDWERHSDLMDRSYCWSVEEIARLQEQGDADERDILGVE